MCISVDLFVLEVLVSVMYLFEVIESVVFFIMWIMVLSWLCRVKVLEMLEIVIIVSFFI